MAEAPDPKVAKGPARIFTTGAFLALGGPTFGLAPTEDEILKFESAISLFLFIIGIIMVVVGYQRLRDLEENGQPVMRSIGKYWFGGFLFAILISIAAMIILIWVER